MESALSNRSFTLREVSPETFLNDILPPVEWYVEIDESVKVVTVNGDPSDEVWWNDTLRTLVWNNISAEGYNLISGALAFDRDFLVCNGRVTSAQQQSYNVASFTDEKPPPQYDVNLELQAMLQMNVAEPLPEYTSIPLAEIPLIQDEKDAAPVATEIPSFDQGSITHSDSATKEVDGESLIWQSTDVTYSMMAQEALPVPSTRSRETRIDFITYKTDIAPIGSTDEDDFTPFGSFAIGTENSKFLHTSIMFNSIEVTQFCSVSSDGNRFVKSQEKGREICPFGFDITFTGEMQQRTFKGTMVNAKGREFEWVGEYSGLSQIMREGTNEQVKGSDGKFLNPLLLTISPVSRNEVEVDKNTGTAIPIDLATREADRIFGRLLMASVDKDISDMLFPGMFNLTPMEKEIQSKGEEFLRRAGVHGVLGHLKSSESVKAKTKNKINKDKCEKFMPMCLATGAQAADPLRDPVKTYGWDRITDKTLLDQLQREALAVTRACYLQGYRTAVTAIEPYLANSAEWYRLLSETVTDQVYLADWKIKASASAGFGKTLYDLQTKLDLLYQTAMDDPVQTAKLPAEVQKPEEIIATINAHTLQASLEDYKFDDTARANVLELFRKLDKLEEEKRQEALTSYYRRQMLIDDSVNVSFSTLGSYALQLLDEARAKVPMTTGTYSIKDAENALSIVEDNHEIVGAGADSPSWFKKMKSKTGFFAYARAAVSVVGLGGLIYLFTNNMATMDVVEQLSMMGQIAEGFVTTSAMMKVFKGSAAGKSMSVAQLFYKKVLAPIGKVAAVVGKWLYNSLGNIGKSLIQGIGSVVSNVSKWISSGVEKITSKFAQAGTWLKNIPIRWGEVFKALANVVSFGISALCFWVAIRDCIAAFKNGRTVDKVMTTIAAALAGLEIICLVVQGICWLFNTGGAIASACAMAGPILAAAGIVFAVVFVIFAFAFKEDLLDNLVEKYGEKYGILYPK